MFNLTRFEKDGIEILIDLNTGEAFASISGYARMCGLSKQAISKRCTVNQTVIKQAEIQTQSGLQGVNLIDEDTITDWIVDDNPVMAKKLMKLGVRVFLHELAGYKVTSEAIQPLPRQLPPVRDKIDYVNAVKDVNHLKGQIPAVLTQLLLDGLGDELATLAGQNQLPPAQPRLIGVAQKAEEMGLPVNLKNRGNLGKFVKAQNLPVYQEEERLCNGQSRKINVYEDNEDLEVAITTFFR